MKALDNIPKYIKVKPGDFTGFKLVGWTYYYLGNMQSAVEYFTKANNIKEVYGNYKGLGLSELKRNNYYSS